MKKNLLVFTLFFASTIVFESYAKVSISGIQKALVVFKKELTNAIQTFIKDPSEKNFNQITVLLPREPKASDKQIEKDILTAPIGKNQITIEVLEQEISNLKPGKISNKEINGQKLSCVCTCVKKEDQTSDALKKLTELLDKEKNIQKKWNTIIETK